MLELKKTEDGMEIITMPQGSQLISAKLVEAGKKQGWLKIKKKVLTIHCSKVGDVSFNVHIESGKKCLHCGANLPNDKTGKVVKKHIATKHKGVKSLDKNKKGFINCDYYELQGVVVKKAKPIEKVEE